MCVCGGGGAFVSQQFNCCAGADPGFLEWGFKIVAGARFVQFGQLFLKFLMKMK